MISWHAAGEADVAPGAGWLAAWEADRAAGMRFTKRRREWLLARWTAKQALARTLGVGLDPAALARLEVRAVLEGPARGAPEVYVDGERAAVEVAITDRAGWAVCAVGPPGGGVPMGCDLELDEPRSDAFVRTFLTPAEQALVGSGGLGRDVLANLVWSAKESALKVLRTGLRRDTRSVEVRLDPTDAAGWQPLEVRTEEGQHLPGWWCRSGPFLLTVAAAAEHPPPVALVEPSPLAGAVPTHSWMADPVVDPAG